MLLHHARRQVLRLETWIEKSRAISSSVALFSSVQHAVSGHGIDYDALAAHARPDLDEQITKVASASLDEMQDHDHMLALHINAYNLHVVRTVLDLRDRSGSFRKNGLRSRLWFLRFFLARRVVVAGRRMSLYHLEHRILRKQFSEPRIHFVLNCASVSCPPLRDGLYTPAHLDDELDMATKGFLATDRGARRAGNTLVVSRIFKWYANDFGGHAGMVRFLSEHLPDHLNTWFQDESPSIRFMSYDWSLNTHASG